MALWHRPHGDCRRAVATYVKIEPDGITAPEWETDTRYAPSDGETTAGEPALGPVAGTTVITSSAITKTATVTTTTATTVSKKAVN